MTLMTRTGWFRVTEDNREIWHNRIEPVHRLCGVLLHYCPRWRWDEVLWHKALIFLEKRKYVWRKGPIRHF